MSSHSSKTTTDLKEIQQWAEQRQGKPAKVKGAGNTDEGEGLIRIDFPGYSGGDSLEEISWEEWYEIFQKNGLAFLYQEETKDGDESRFFKLVNNK
ncbi:hypothetical protein [Telluribacter sp. SYSU D00476]|uniref:hypothetical protein n=1 Tax=Telluribacter sp. SYSU D00476 TaxID=2811430 RepID=UPI001FF64A54|nr:hypothetical protein [Telluribacter sp. SYSU D00476]